MNLKHLFLLTMLCSVILFEMKYIVNIRVLICFPLYVLLVYLFEWSDYGTYLWRRHLKKNGWWSAVLGPGIGMFVLIYIIYWLGLFIFHKIPIVGETICTCAPVIGHWLKEHW